MGKGDILGQLGNLPLTFSSPLQELSKLIPKSVVGELKSDSRNVVQLIEDAYKVRTLSSLAHHKLILIRGNITFPVPPST